MADTKNKVLPPCGGGFRWGVWRKPAEASVLILSLSKDEDTGASYFDKLSMRPKLLWRDGSPHSLTLRRAAGPSRRVSGKRNLLPPPFQTMFSVL